MKFFTRMLALALLSVSLAACDKTPKPPLVFGADLRPGYEPVYLARELGYFSAVNLRLCRIWQCVRSATGLPQPYDLILPQ